MTILQHMAAVLWALGGIVIAATLLVAPVIGIWGKRHEEVDR